MKSSTLQFVLILSLFIINQLVIYFRKPADCWNDQYLDNLLAIPILLYLWKIEYNWLNKNALNAPLPLINIALATLFIAVVSEIVFPRLSSNFVSDNWDYFYYVLGGIYFSLFMNGFALSSFRKYG